MIDLPSGKLHPVLPLRDIVVFPLMIVALVVGGGKSVRARGHGMEGGKPILVGTPKTASDEDPSPDDIFTLGTIGTVLQLLKLPDGTVKVLVEGVQRARINGYKDNPEFFEAYAELIEDAGDLGDIEALSRAVVSQFEQYIKLNKKIPAEVLLSLIHI